jgi:hypothetical protein
LGIGSGNLGLAISSRVPYHICNRVVFFQGAEIGTLYVTKAVFSSGFNRLGIVILRLIFPFVKVFCLIGCAKNMWISRSGARPIFPEILPAVAQKNAPGDDNTVRILDCPVPA